MHINYKNRARNICLQRILHDVVQENGKTVVNVITSIQYLSHSSGELSPFSFYENWKHVFVLNQLENIKFIHLSSNLFFYIIYVGMRM